MVSLFSMPYTVLMPVFATQLLGGGSYIQGYLMSVIGYSVCCRSGHGSTIGREKFWFLLTARKIR